MVALITGSTGGLGKAIAFSLAEVGFDLILHYHNDEVGVLNLASDIRNKYKRNVRMYKADLASEDEIDKMVSDIKENYFSLDVLVNNAAISKDTDLLLKEKEEFLNVLDVNLVAPFLLSKKLSSLSNSQLKELFNGVNPIFDYTYTINGISYKESFPLTYEGVNASNISVDNSALIF